MAKKKTRTSAKRTNKKSLSKNNFMIISVISVVVLVSAVIGSLLYFGYHFGPKSDGIAIIVPMSPEEVDARRDRIEAIYDSLKLGPEYKLQSESVFGQKRLYTYDKGRSFSSAKEYVRESNVSTVADELKTKIEEAGFKFFDEPYPNAVPKQYHFQSSNGEYLRLSVSSKPLDDYVYKHKELSDEYYKMDSNAGPSNVIIKVNLDDNNE